VVKQENLSENNIAKTIDEKKRQPKNAMADRWHEGLENHERLKKLLPFLNEEDGYL